VLAPCLRSVALLLAVASSGCLFRATLDANGGGRLTLRYRLLSVLHFEQHKAQLTSPSVSLASSVLAPDKWATFDLEFADVRQLSSVPLLANARFELTEGEYGARTLGVTIDNKVAQPMPELVQTYLGRDFKVSTELPGRVIASNATTVDGRTASWTLPIGEVATRSVIDFTATFEPAARPAAAAQGG
jgi:hypothetical protein